MTFHITSASWPIGATMSSGNNTVQATWTTCALADRAADEQIAMLEREVDRLTNHPLLAWRGRKRLALERFLWSWAAGSTWRMSIVKRMPLWLVDVDAADYGRLEAACGRRP